MGLPEQITTLIEKEVERRVYERTCEVIERLSNKFNIPVGIARRELLSNSVFCMGVKQDGRVCTNKSSRDGYCSHHIKGSRPIVNVKDDTDVRHNHPFPSGKVAGCPRCELETRSNLENTIKV